MKTTKYEFADHYRQFLKRNLSAAKDAAGNTEIVCRCKYCPDSRNPTHGHMYISIPENSEDISVFYCQKCHTSGIVSNKTLIEWGIYDPEIAIEISNINASAEKHGKMKGYDRKVYNLINRVLNFDLAEKKLSYINKRLGTNLTIKEAMEDKVIFNLEDVLIYNRVEKLTRNQNIIKQLNQYFVGTLSLDNNFVNLRRLCSEGVVYQGIDKRYINYNIHGKKDNTEKSYVIPYYGNLSLPRRLKIHIAEGPFDILSIKHNLRKETESSIYVAITGSAYKGLLMYLMNSLKLYYIEVHLYPDNDDSGNNYVVMDLVNFLKPYGIPVYVHRNVKPGEKDFGVCLNKIQEVITRVDQGDGLFI